LNYRFLVPYLWVLVYDWESVASHGTERCYCLPPSASVDDCFVVAVAHSFARTQSNRNWVDLWNYSYSYGIRSVANVGLSPHTIRTWLQMIAS
jgi:hypothetical protein